MLLTIIIIIIVLCFILPVFKSAIKAAASSNSGQSVIDQTYHGVFYVVRQQHCAAVERLGKFHNVVGPGFHMRLPILDKARDVNLMTEDQHMTFDAKTSDNVTIELDVSIQYHVDFQARDDEGIYKSLYTLTDPVSQMKDYFADALRSEIPVRTLDEVFTEKETIAASIDSLVAEKMRNYGYVIVTTLITSIRLPGDVQASMNRIIASKNNLESAKNEAEAERQRTIIAAVAKAEAMEKEGEGIAKQRAAIAQGIRDSLDIIKGAELTSNEANHLFEFTQWIGMMEEYAKFGTNTVVLPNDFKKTSSVFDQIVAAKAVTTKPYKTVDQSLGQQPQPEPKRQPQKIDDVPRTHQIENPHQQPRQNMFR